MGGGNHNAGIGLIIPGGKRQSGDGHQGIINANLNSVCCQNLRGIPGEHIGIDPGVVGDGHQLVSALGLHPVGQTLSSLTDDIDVHAVGACTQHAPQTSGAEFQSHRKPFFDFLVLTFNGLQLGNQRRVFQFGIQPAFIIFCVHGNHLSFQNMWGLHISTKVIINHLLRIVNVVLFVKTINPSLRRQAEGRGKVSIHHGKNLILGSCAHGFVNDLTIFHDE